MLGSRLPLQVIHPSPHSPYTSAPLIASPCAAPAPLPPPPYLYPLSSPHCFSMRGTKMSLSGRNGIGPHSVGPQLQGGREEGERAKGGGGLRGIGRASLDWPLVSLCRQSEKRGRQMLLLATHLSG